jgi:hypothetical protein
MYRFSPLIQDGSRLCIDGIAGVRSQKDQGLEKQLRSRDRCYDFLNIFAKKFSEKNWRF